MNIESLLLGLCCNVFFIRSGLPVELFDVLENLLDFLSECLRNVQQHVRAMDPEEEP